MTPTTWGVWDQLTQITAEIDDEGLTYIVSTWLTRDAA